MKKLLSISQISTEQTFWLAVALISTACAMVVITYGMDTVIAGAHDTFHDFRHTIGMGCH